MKGTLVTPIATTPLSTPPPPRLATHISRAPVTSSAPHPTPMFSIGLAPQAPAAPILGASTHPSDITSSNVMPPVALATPPNPTLTPMDVNTTLVAEMQLDDVDTSEIYQDHGEA